MYMYNAWSCGEILFSNLTKTLYNRRIEVPVARSSHAVHPGIAGHTIHHRHHN